MGITEETPVETPVTPEVAPEVTPEVVAEPIAEPIVEPVAPVVEPVVAPVEDKSVELQKKLDFYEKEIKKIVEEPVKVAMQKEIDGLKGLLGL